MAEIKLKEIPNDIRKYILKVQGESKEKKCVAQYSQELTIYQIIREHKEFSEKNKLVAAK